MDRDLIQYPKVSHTLVLSKSIILVVGFGKKEEPVELCRNGKHQEQCREILHALKLELIWTPALS